jgi:hypothetical protein
MTTYTTIPNEDIDQDSSVTQTLMTLLRDNPIALSEGSAGAPRIQDAALSTTVTEAGGDWVRLRYAKTLHGEIGAVVFAAYIEQAGTTLTVNAIVGGGNLRACNAKGVGGIALTGSWRLLGQSIRSSNDAAARASLWQRVA